MPTIITIGYRRFLLKDTANLNVLLKCFEGAIALEYDHIGTKKVFYPDTDRTVDVSVEIVSKKQVLLAKPRIAIPEKASADCHGKDITGQ